MRTTLGSDAVSHVQTDWIVFALPTVLALRFFATARGAVFMLAVLALIALMRRERHPSSLAIGPFACLAAATGIVFYRTSVNSSTMIVMMLGLLMGLIILISVMTRDGRSVITSLIDGLGLYLIINVFGWLVGIRSPGAADRIGALAESTGFKRVVFPFSAALEEPPVLAGIFLATVPFLLLRESRWRWYRVACAVAALVVAWGGASRTALLVALSLPLISFLAPTSYRWMTQVSAVFASFSAFLLPPLGELTNSSLSPILKLISPVRDTNSTDVESLAGRTQIWSRALDFWSHHIRDFTHQFFGYGQAGQARSGASLTYAHLLAGASKHPEQATVHNAFLQQLFDGGVVGWASLTIAAMWAGIRLTHRVSDWGPYGRAAVVALSAVLLASTTGVTVAPGFVSAGFMVLTALVAVSCQIPAGARDPHGQAVDKLHPPRISARAAAMPVEHAIRPAGVDRPGRR